MAAQVEVKLRRMRDGAVHSGAGWNISALPHLQSKTKARETKQKYSVRRGGGGSTYPLSFVGAEQTRVMALLHHDVGDARPVVLFQTDARLPYGDQLRPGHLKHGGSVSTARLGTRPALDGFNCALHLFHLSLGNAAAIINDACGLESCGLVELDEKLAHHVGQVLDHLLAEKLLL